MDGPNEGLPQGYPPTFSIFASFWGLAGHPKSIESRTFDRQGGLWMTFFGNFWCQSKYYAILHRFWSKNRWKTALFWLRFRTAARAFWKPGKPWKSLFYLRKTMIFNNSRFPRFPFFPSKNAKNPIQKAADGKPSKNHALGFHFGTQNWGKSMPATSKVPKIAGKPAFFTDRFFAWFLQSPLSTWEWKYRKIPAALDLPPASGLHRGEWGES